MIEQLHDLYIDDSTGEVLTPSQVALHFVMIENSETLQQLAVLNYRGAVYSGDEMGLPPDEIEWGTFDD